MAMSRWGGEKEKEGVEEGEWVFTPSHHGRQPALKEERGGDAETQKSLALIARVLLKIEYTILWVHHLVGPRTCYVHPPTHPHPDKMCIMLPTGSVSCGLTRLHYSKVYRSQGVH
ncbi:hypothetical protein C0Q70_04066 [Pomacea canaliculata]|uniref:Uncharacterized protein n=1 Tax=Pomacea canaliculata TaxID=400727 RepID=A0A2T7PUH3_POMCA|nr:hypothetical protein C0Q70_04066 [Pomacea canaliculata]